MCGLLTDGCCQLVTHANTRRAEIVKPETGPGGKLRLSLVVMEVGLSAGQARETFEHDNRKRSLGSVYCIRLENVQIF